MPAKVNFNEYVNWMNREADIFEALPIVMLEEVRDFSEAEKEELLKKVARDLIQITTLNGLESWLNSVPLVDAFEPVHVGFGLVLKPRTVGDALTVFRNTTLRLHKQAMTDAILRAIENLPFAHLDEDFFKGYFSHLRFIVSTEGVSSETFLLQNIVAPLLKKVTQLLLDEKIDFRHFVVHVSYPEYMTLKELKQTFNNPDTRLDHENLRRLRCFLASLGTVATTALDFAIYDTKRSLAAARQPTDEDLQNEERQQEQQERDNRDNEEEPPSDDQGEPSDTENDEQNPPQ